MEGSDADILVWDPEATRTISVETHHQVNRHATLLSHLPTVHVDLCEMDVHVHVDIFLFVYLFVYCCFTPGC